MREFIWLLIIVFVGSAMGGILIDAALRFFAQWRRTR